MPAKAPSRLLASCTLVSPALSPQPRRWAAAQVAQPATFSFAAGVGQPGDEDRWRRLASWASASFITSKPARVRVRMDPLNGVSAPEKVSDC